MSHPEGDSSRSHSPPSSSVFSHCMNWHPSVCMLERHYLYPSSHHYYPGSIVRKEQDKCPMEKEITAYSTDSTGMLHPSGSPWGSHFSLGTAEVFGFNSRIWLLYLFFILVTCSWCGRTCLPAISDLGLCSIWDGLEKQNLF